MARPYHCGYLAYRVHDYSSLSFGIQQSPFLIGWCIHFSPSSCYSNRHAGVNPGLDSSFNAKEIKRRDADMEEAVLHLQ